MQIKKLDAVEFIKNGKCPICNDSLENSQYVGDIIISKRVVKYGRLCNSCLAAWEEAYIIGRGTITRSNITINYSLNTIDSISLVNNTEVTLT